MKKTILYIIIIGILTSCSQGVWITNNVYRPKHLKFKILTELFKNNILINSNYIYLSTKRFLNYDGNKVIGYMGFYNDGRLIIDNSWENQLLNTLSSRNSFKTASSIGYYTTTESNTIRLEYFAPGDGGHYEAREGIIKIDTIILIETLQGRNFKKEIRSDTLVKSNFLLK